jgi:hypothetical protein
LFFSSEPKKGNDRITSEASSYLGVLKKGDNKGKREPSILCVFVVSMKRESCRRRANRGKRHQTRFLASKKLQEQFKTMSLRASHALKSFSSDSFEETTFIHGISSHRLRSLQ